ncbi:MAG: hypothetical protein WCF77_05340 [Minisyncoccia bacterium]|jgi:hypothetical protein
MESLRIGPEPILFRDAYWTVTDAKGILSFRDAEFADEFWKRVRAITAAFAEENGWTAEELAGMFSEPAHVLDVELGPNSLAKLEEFTAWLQENVSFCLDG